MTCHRGKANPDAHTRRRLWASSGGFCQKPDCNNLLLLEVGKARFHIAEIAHICAANDDGPRANVGLSEAERGAFENLILLCPTCHTIVDKAPDEFPDTTVLDWKRTHSGRIAQLFGVRQYASRADLREEVERLLDQGRHVHADYGPDNDYRFNPESEEAALWTRKVAETLMPNNEKLLRVLDANRSLLSAEERGVVEQFRQHALDFAARHNPVLDDPVGARRFPTGMNTILTEEER